MTRTTVTRRWLLNGLAAGMATPAMAREAPFLRPKPRPRFLGGAPAVAAPAVHGAPSAEEIIARAKLSGQVGFAVIDERTGAVLESAGADLALPPASTAKTLTTAYALETLGPDFRFVTELIATGPVENGVLQGDLVLVGSGDPALLTDDLGQMAMELRKAGVLKVAGQFRVGDGALPAIQQIDPTQPPQVDYNPGISGLNLNFNRFYFGWKKERDGWALTLDARGARFDPPVSVEKVTVVDRSTPPYTYEQSGGLERWTVAQVDLGSHGSRWLPVRNPGAYVGDVFRALAAEQGIELPPPAVAADPPAGTVLVSHQSGDLRGILQVMLKYSTNVTAEIVGLTASQKRGGPVSSLAESAARMVDWAKGRFGIAPHLIDHSGMGVANRATPMDMVRILKGAESVDLRGILKPILILDDHGRIERNSGITVQGKTGTLNFVSNLVGYERTRSGRELIFAVLTGDIARNSEVPMLEREEPPGLHYWLNRSRAIQQALMNRWNEVYG